MITVKQIPAALKTDRQVNQFIARSEELQIVDPIISYFCRLHIMTYLITNDMHHMGPEVQHFVELIMEDTEPVYMRHHNENIRNVLASKQKSINYVFFFAFKVYNGCLEDLNKYDGTTKAALANKLRASLNFWTLLSLFTVDTDDPLDFAEATAGQVQSKAEFLGYLRDKLKAVKFQLSRVLTDRCPVKKSPQGDNEMDVKSTESVPKAAETPKKEVVTKKTTIEPLKDSVEKSSESPSAEVSSENGTSEIPESDEISKKETVETESAPSEESEILLPGAPRFDPGADSDKIDSSISLPGAPKFLPDDDPSSVIKNASIQVFPPGENKDKEAARPKPLPRRTASSGIVTQESLHTIIDTTESIGKIQKHAKFAISALNYEDFSTAEAELTKGLELLRLLKKKA